MTEDVISVRTRGNVFNGKAELILSSSVRTAARTIAEYAEERVQAILYEVLQHPTGAYQARINIRGVNQYAYAVNDDNCIYGPWLEGTGSRNTPVTRFPGYSTFRRVAQELEGVAVMKAEEAIKPAVEEINI